MTLIMYFWLWIAAALTLVAGLVLLTKEPKSADFIAFGFIVLGIFTAWATLHPRQTPLMSEARAVQAMIGAGKPVLLEFQSPY